jgi:hypothetical protein
LENQKSNTRNSTQTTQPGFHEDSAIMSKSKVTNIIYINDRIADCDEFHGQLVEKHPSAGILKVGKSVKGGIHQCYVLLTNLAEAAAMVNNKNFIVEGHHASLSLNDFPTDSWLIVGNGPSRSDYEKTMANLLKNCTEDPLTDTWQLGCFGYKEEERILDGKHHVFKMVILSFVRGAREFCDTYQELDPEFLFTYKTRTMTFIPWSGSLARAVKHSLGKILNLHDSTDRENLFADPEAHEEFLNGPSKA